MAVSCSIVTSGDLMVYTLVPSCGNLLGFVKPGGIIFGDRSNKICSKGRLSIRSGGTEGCIVFDFGQWCNDSGRPSSKGMNYGRNLSSSCYPDGVVPEMSTDAALNFEPLSNLALSPDQWYNSNELIKFHFLARTSPSRRVLKLLSGSCYLPHPDKEEKGGEDAHFICADKQVIGVADGVGGWAKSGVDAGIYARELMSNAVKAIRKMPDGDIDPLRVLEKAHAATNAKGSSTACIIALKNEDLHAINLGDSGFIVIREGSTVFKSPVQQHRFNFTYQLQRGTEGDVPSSGQIFKISVVPGDVIVAASDGLFDNLYTKEITAIVADAIKGGLSPYDTAQKIAAFARAQALDSKYRSPFSVAAQNAGLSFYGGKLYGKRGKPLPTADQKDGFSSCGGKLDDLTVVVSYVSTSPDV